MNAPCKTIKVIDAAKAGLRIRQMRQEAGLTVETVATRLRITKGYLSDLELGKRAITAERYAEAVRAIRGDAK